MTGRDGEPAVAAFDWRIYVRLGAAMGWTPAEVGATGLAEFHAAFDGWAAATGRKVDDGKGTTMSREEAKALRAELWGDA